MIKNVINMGFRPGCLCGSTQCNMYMHLDRPLKPNAVQRRLDILSVGSDNKQSQPPVFCLFSDRLECNVKCKRSGFNSHPDVSLSLCGPITVTRANKE